MRLIKTLNDQQKARQLAAFLGAEGIENQLEITSNNDWGSDHYGDMTCRLWIINEDAVDQAQHLIETYENNPSDPHLQATIAQAMPQEDLFTQQAVQPDEILTEEQRKQSQNNPRANRRQTRKFPDQGTAITTNFYLIMICCLLFLVDFMSSPEVTNINKNLPVVPQLASPIKKECLYDYPQTYVLTDQIIAEFGQDKILNPQDLPPEGQKLYKQILSTPYWHGYYQLIKNSWTRTNTPEKVNQQVNAPLFEKIRQGEVWRLFTPCFIHLDVLHLLFNMLWLIVLGQQLEQRIGPRRYILFSLIVGVVSNTCQYLMSGPDFFGYSGIVCGMLAFIFVRQKVAAWEGYPLQKSTINFLLFFIVSMMLVQFLSFYLETQHGISISPGLANTAHITGAAIGALLGLTPLFSWKS